MEITYEYIEKRKMCPNQLIDPSVPTTLTGIVKALISKYSGMSCRPENALEKQ